MRHIKYEIFYFFFRVITNKYEIYKYNLHMILLYNKIIRKDRTNI
jgi:hypothetical protein